MPIRKRCKPPFGHSFFVYSTLRHVVGFPGLACKHCYGGNGSGRFFPLTLKTFSDVSKSLHVLRNHLVKCAKAPTGLSAKVCALYEMHENEKVRHNKFSIVVTTLNMAQHFCFAHKSRAIHRLDLRRSFLITYGEGFTLRCTMALVKSHPIKDRNARESQALPPRNPL